MPIFFMLPKLTNWLPESEPQKLNNADKTHQKQVASLYLPKCLWYEFINNIVNFINWIFDLKPFLLAYAVHRSQRYRTFLTFKKQHFSKSIFLSSEEKISEALEKLNYNPTSTSEEKKLLMNYSIFLVAAAVEKWRRFDAFVRI